MADYPELLRRTDAVGRLLDLRSAVLSDRLTESVGLDAVAGRTLAEPVVAETDLPPRSHATMDGFAFDAESEYPLRVREEDVFPEDDPEPLPAGTAVRIATGAPLPPGANAVLKREDATVTDGRLRGEPVDPGTYTYERGSNVAAGETVFEAGERLAPRDAILLGDLGFDSVSVRERLDVRLLATGTEIHEGRSRDLDSPMLAGLVRSWGHDATYEGTVPDEYDVVAERIAALAAESDVVVTTGGTSVGKKDYAVRALADLGAVLFHGVRVRPGKPIAAARLPDHDAVAIAVPGKPVGAHVVSTLVARHLFVGDARLPTVTATAERGVGVGKRGFEYVVPVVLDGDGGGGDSGEGGDDGSVGGGDEETARAMPLGHVDSPLSVYEHTFDPSVLSSSTRATRADGFVVTETGFDAGDAVSVVPYPAVE